MATKRVCAEPGCPALIDAGARDGRCDQHRRANDRARGTSTERGYGTTHQRLRARYQRRMDAGETFTCWRCEAKGTPHLVDPRSWDLGHDGGVHRGPECPAGNRAEPRLRGA